MWSVNAVLFAAILGSGGAIQGAAGRLSGDPDRFSAEAGAPVVPERAGYLQFVVEPWAEVHIDGQHVLTTPSARRIALPPGRHWIRLQNPYFDEVDREVWVSENETQLVEVDLEAAPAPPPEPSPAAPPPPPVLDDEPEEEPEDGDEVTE